MGVLVSTEMTKPPKDKRNIKSAFSAEDATEQKVLSAMCFDAASLVKMHSPVEEKYPTSASSSPCLSKCSRYGRDSQRWDGETRLVTGAVPITKNGKILMCSAASKREWILPKGGWESDESIEESAKREAYEEAGVLGELGPRLSAITFETRKSKKMRLDAFAEETRAGDSSTSSGAAINESGSTVEAGFNLRTVSSDGCENVHSVIVGKLPFSQFEQMPKIPCDMYSSSSGGSTISCDEDILSNELSSKNIDDTRKSHIKNARLCRMILFPLYVSEVLECWPESGRKRKVMGIDEALKASLTRPEMHSALLEIKERGLHTIS